jgi:hypothetical protein
MHPVLSILLQVPEWEPREPEFTPERTSHEFYESTRIEISERIGEDSCDPWREYWTLLCHTAPAAISSLFARTRVGRTTMVRGIDRYRRLASANDYRRFK